MTGHDFRLDPQLDQQGPEPHAEGMDTHQIEFGAEQPPRIVLAKAGRLHHRLLLVGEAVGDET